MKYPKINRNPRRGISIPNLSGGLNLRDAKSDINDNQLTDCQNVWYKNGMLQSRPGIATEEKLINKIGRINDKTKVFGTKIHNDITVFTESKNKPYTLTSFKRQDGEGSFGDTNIFFFWQSESDIISNGFITVSETDTYFSIRKRDRIYTFVSNGKIYQNDYKTGTEWTEVPESDIYAPIIATDCLPSGSIIGFESTPLEGMNLIGNRYRMIYSTVNRNILEKNNAESKHPMIYELEHRLLDTKYDGKKVIAKITKGGTTTTHEVTLLNGRGEESTALADGLKMSVQVYCVWFHTADGQNAYVSWDDYEYNNLEIEAPYLQTEETKKKVYGMIFPKWFGGSSEGINGGTRLFLCGNTAERNLVIWSGLDNPLYFSENSYFYVGEDSSSVNAMAAQGEKLIIFKTDSIYYSYYTRNGKLNGKDIIELKVLDYKSNNVFFPLVLIDDSIGCDCPQSIQLCRNRLVWASSIGKIYTLVSQNEYSERNIFEIGQMIESELRNASLIKATSVDWNDRYIITCENNGRFTAYIMEYNSNGYQYPYSFNKSEDANINVPWYKWNFEPINETAAFLGAATANINNSLMICGYLESDSAENCSYVAFKADFSKSEDNCLNWMNEIIDKPFCSQLQTKLFEFGLQDFRKNVDAVSLALGNNSGVPIEINLVTDVGEEADEITLDSDETDSFSPGYVSSKTIRPCIRAVIRCGVRLSSEGKLAINGITFKYRVLGGA